jgi:hypothetical protein
MKNRKRISIEGFWDITPKIKKLSFETRGKITISLEDGRTIMAPLSRFPGIKNLSSAQRAKWYLFGNGFSFDDSNEVYHIEQILGNYQTYNHEVI